MRATVAVFVVWVGLYVAVAHGLGGMSMGQGEAMHGVGICLVVLAVTATVAAAAVRSRLLPRIAPVLAAAPVLLVPPSHVAVPSRASPAWLQRFLN